MAKKAQSRQGMVRIVGVCVAALMALILTAGSCNKNDPDTLVENTLKAWGYTNVVKTSKKTQYGTTIFSVTVGNGGPRCVLHLAVLSSKNPYQTPGLAENTTIKDPSANEVRKYASTLGTESCYGS